MPSYDALIGHLPSLYRPQAQPAPRARPSSLSDPVALVLAQVGSLLDRAGDDMQAILQAHWERQADRAALSPYFALRRALEGLGPIDPVREDDQQTLFEFPYLNDLARLGKLLPLVPWREPTELRESVEAYRLRLERYVAMQRNGLGTVPALRAAVEAELPQDRSFPAEQHDRSFGIEECAPLSRVSRRFETRGNPLLSPAEQHLVGPLMRWRFENVGLTDTAPVAIIEGLAPLAGTIDACQAPLLERFQTSVGRPPVGFAYTGAVAAGEALRVRAAYQCWLALATGLHETTASPAGEADAESNRVGPWAAAAGAPAGQASALHRAHDHTLWVAIAADEGAELWRHTGSAWLRVLAGEVLPAIHTLADDGTDLLVGTDSGLLRVGLYPLAEQPFEAQPVAALVGAAVFALMDLGAERWCATDAGVFVLDGEDQVITTHLASAHVRALHRDREGVIWCGGDAGLFQYQASTARWYFYQGGAQSDQHPDWAPLMEALPAREAQFLPPITAIAEAPDRSLWLGTSAGLARWRARQVSGSAFETVLEAYPDLGVGPVQQIVRDERGLLVFATERGLLRYDGRDLAQFRADLGRWVALGRADSLYGVPPRSVTPRGAWRFQNDQSVPAWQRFDPAIKRWMQPALALRATGEPACRALLWVDRAHAELGSWDGSVFQKSADVDPALLRMRVKPEDQRPVDGGIPALPRLPPGASVWRYLALEAGEVTSTQRPHWTTEGRLLPDPVQPAPHEGRYAPYVLPPEAAEFDQHVFAYDPQARVWLQWRTPRPRSVVIRLLRRAANESLHPAVVERVWQAVQRVRAAGVHVALALDEDWLRGGGA